MSGARGEDERFTTEALALFTADDEFPRDPPPPLRPVVDAPSIDNYPPLA
ncbi:hypothetical protein ACGFZP_05230 [Kitasatospora sp. NPDC048239]